MSLTHSDITALVQLFGDSDWNEMHLKYDGEEIFLSKDPASPGPVPATANAVPAGPGAVAPAQPVPPASAARTQAPAAPEIDRSGWVEIKAPNLGTFYRAPSPDADPYVTEGATVTEDTEICLVEVMKLFTTIRAGMAGTVREIAAEDGQMVEFGATLMWIEPGA
ncbi:acetyl-CoA carboxylase biotin carboxyl carrier protein [Chachezhania sediminis]|uniref:acetyl-CoA carboxylase biotin carboxyl carrier protein n=1 Tax=Chachezhania sediminis TaxID=2599291 RepID=UPI00131AB875|nr:acetyl-CoA carboxylase biotin carboxyl carrier protein [Chachezhania sediminis]